MLEEMNQKQVLRWYMLGKQSIEYENCYRNNGNSAFLAKARTNFLQLEEHLGREKQTIILPVNYVDKRKKT